MEMAMIEAEKQTELFEFKSRFFLRHSRKLVQKQ
jgi:hypothetical protein